MTFKRLLFFMLIFMGWTSLSYGAGDWTKYRCQHFNIYYKDAPIDFIKTVEKAAEDYYDEITRNLGFTRYKSWSWDDRAIIYIYRDADDYVANSRQYKWSHGSASVREKIIRTFPAAHGFFDSTLPHELGHIIFREFVGYKFNVPLWLDEGVAMYQEKAKRWGVNKDVKKAVKNGSFIALQDLSNLRLTNRTSKSVIDLFYAESASIVYFMITELGEHRFVNFCRQLKKGKKLKDALHLAYVRFRKVEDLNKAWVDYLKR